MMLIRPKHLVHRPMRGQSFSVPIVILRARGSWNIYDEYSEEFDRIATYCAYAPISVSSGISRRLMEGGVDVEGALQVWTVEELNPAVEGKNAGDQILFNETMDPTNPLYGEPAEMYRVKSTARWGGWSESICERREGQQ